MLVHINKKEEQENKIGNKGKFLIQMKKEGFNVPSGIILDTDTFDEIISKNNLIKKINDNLHKLEKNNLKEISKKLISLFNKISIPKQLLNDIISNLNTNKKYAVRSSGTKEDLDNLSFAGQYETFLNVEVKDIEKNIIKCYQSMYTETVLSYLINNKISLDDLKMSVVIQEMVNSEYSGICFTINPTTGNDTEMLIEVSKGLGENIVSGKTAPEQYYYDWYNNTTKYDKNNKILNKKQLVEYAKVFSNIQLYFGYPCDIEFAIEKNKLYILQARKITKIKYSGIEDIWTTADFKEGGVSATTCTPYMWSLYEYIWEYTLRKFITDSKILKNNELPKKLGKMYYGRCYWNLSAVKKSLSQIIGYKEREFDSEYGVTINYEGGGKVTKISPKSLFKLIGIAIKQKEIVQTRKANAEKYKEDLLNKYYDYKDKYDNKSIVNIEKTWYQLTKGTYLYSESTYFWQIFINTVHQSLYKESLLKYVSEGEYLTLLSSIEDISHLLPFYEMWDISREIRSNKDILKYWNTTNTKDIQKSLNKKDNLLPKVKELINKYGYHSDKELDITYPCYYEEKNILIDSIKSMIELEDKFSPLEDKKRGELKYTKILNKLEKEVSKKTYKKITNKINTMRKMLWWREEFRDISTRFYYIIRMYTLEYAKYLKNKNIINNIEDIWYTRVSDLWSFIDKKMTKKELLITIEKNKKYYNSYINYMSENEIGSVFNEEDNTIPKESKNTLKGIGANNGIITGKARVINDFSEIDRLQKEDILITKFTDTGWTSKFAILSGIVTEYGGILCHAAIVSREYGIPAIVCCKDALTKIKDGQTITINGTTGEVKIKE